MPSRQALSKGGSSLLLTTAGGVLFLSRRAARGSSNERGKSMRQSTNTALDGYDYEKQAWYRGGVYIRCGHLDSCDCYGTLHAGEPVRGN